MAFTEQTGKIYNLAGIYRVTIGDGAVYDMRLPGTLDESNIGFPDRKKEANDPDFSDFKDPLDRLLSDDDLLREEKQPEEDSEENVIMTRYTRKYTFEGEAVISGTLTWQEAPNKRLFLEVERARALRLFVDGAEIAHYTAPSLATPHVFEVTGRLHGTHTLTFISDNSYKGMPREEIISSNMASEETETNWNGLLGYLRLREENEVFIENIRILPKGGTLTAQVEVSSPYACETAIRMTSPVFTREYVTKISVKEHYASFIFDGLKIRENALRWEEDEGILSTFTAELQNGERKMVSFGNRTFSVSEDHRFLLNGRPIFLRGETNSAVHPDTSYCPTDVSTWLKIFKQYRMYGANFVRFASHCPPEAAFQAADELGMLVMVGLSCHQHEGAYRTEEAQAYYRLEATRILMAYGNHPSLVMMSFGSGEKTLTEVPEFLASLLSLAKALDPTRLYTPGANVISPDADFIMADRKEDLPEHVNFPVLTSCTGLFEMLPDFSEIDLFSGVLMPKNLDVMRRNVEKAGLTAVWKKYVEASGETALRRYREAVERCYLDPRVSGVTIVGLTDYPGRGKPPVGMMNTHLVPKHFDFAEPSRFAAFFSQTAVLCDLPRFAYSYGETLAVPIYVMNYGRETLSYPLKATLSQGNSTLEHVFERTAALPGRVTKIGEIRVALGQDGDEDRTARRMTLTLRFGALESKYPVFVYPSLIPMCPENVLETSELTDAALQYLNDGGNVFITPPVSDGKSLGGRYLDASHPIFRRFGAESFTDVNWRDIPARYVYELPKRFKPIVMKFRQPTNLTPAVQLFETRVLNGAVLVSSLGLKEKITQPEVAALLSCIYSYMGSYEFSPNQEMRVSELTAVLKTLQEER